MAWDYDDIREDDEFITIDDGCAIIGGKKNPIHPSTYYRGVSRGIYPPPFHPSPGVSRIVKRHLVEARARIHRGHEAA